MKVLVAQAGDGAVIGWLHVFGNLHLESESFAEIAGLVVGEDHRGRGAGARLVAAAEAWARARGYGQLCVRCNVLRERTHRFYEGMGFGRIKTQAVFRRSL